MQTCPHCKQPLTVDPVEALRQWCRDNGHTIWPVDRVSEETAAAILGRSPATLRNWRSMGYALPFVRSGAGHGRISYRLSDVALFLENSDELFT